MSTILKNKCDIVISDLDSARIKEFELLKGIRGEFPGIGLIVEIDTIEDWVHMVSLGVSDYLTKIFSDTELNVIVEALYRKLLYNNTFGDYSRKR